MKSHHEQILSQPTEFSDGSISSDATLQPQALEEKRRLPSTVAMETV